MLALSAIRARLDKPALQALAGFAIVFWGLRFWYWLSIHEPPFSDMADYANVGENIAKRFFFAVNDGLYAYYTPVTPSFIAIAKIVGGAHEMMVFRLMIAGLLFVPTIALAYELATLVGNRWIGAGALAVVALSKPSIFWVGEARRAEQDLHWHAFTPELACLTITAALRLGGRGGRLLAHSDRHSTPPTPARHCLSIGSAKNSRALLTIPAPRSPRLAAHCAPHARGSRAWLKRSGALQR